MTQEAALPDSPGVPPPVAVRGRRFDPVLFVVLALAALFLPLRGVEPTPDTFLYLDRALQIYLHPGADSLLVRRPVFPALLAASFALLGPGIKSGFLVVRLFFAANLLLVYLLGRRLSGRWAGLAAALMVLTSGVMNDWSSRLLLDNVVLGFVLAHVLLLLQALGSGRAGWFFASGAMLGASFLVKEVIAAPFALLPAALCLFPEFRSRIRGGMPAFLAGIALPTVPFALAVLSRPEGAQLLLGPIWKVLQGRWTSPGAPAGAPELRPLLKIGIRPDSLFRTYISGQFVIWPLLVLGLCGTLWRAAVRRERTAGILAVVFALHLPLFLVVGRMNLRMGQLLVPVVLLYLMLAVLLAGEGFGRRLRVLGALLVGCALAVQFFVDVGVVPRFRDLAAGFRSASAGPFSWWRGGFVVYGGYAAGARASARWAMKHVSPGEVVATGVRLASVLSYYSRGRIRTVIIEPQPLNREFLGKLEAGTIRPGKALYVVWRGGLAEVQYEGLLRDQLNRGRARWVFLQRRQDLMDVFYFVKNPRMMFTRALAGRSVRVFRVVRPPLRPSFEAVLRFGQGSYEPLRQCFGRPERYPGEHRAWLIRVLGMYDADADLLLSVLRSGPRWAFVQPFTREGVVVRAIPVVE